jgi:hypothetical protein
MPYPESVGNQSREECEDGIDRMPKPDPSAEERADSINLGAPAEIEEGAVRQWIADEIRAAVEAERERCAKPVDEALRTLREHWIDAAAYRSAVELLESLAAAIRAKPAQR